MLEFCSRHRTKIVGLAQTAIGGVVTYMPSVQAFMKPLHYGLGMMVLGVTTTVLGFVNTFVKDKE